MPIEFIGSLVNGSTSLADDPGYPARMAGLHEESGFDRLLVGNGLQDDSLVNIMLEAAVIWLYTF